MPKKTKKQKLLALYRKKLSLLENKTAVAQTTVVSQSQQPTETPKQEIKEMIVTSENKGLHQYFFSDLKKSLILISLIIGLEVSLYFFHLIK